MTPDQFLPSDESQLGNLCTYGVDSRQLLRQVQHDGDQDGLAVHGRAEELRDGHLLLPHHLPALLLHLLHVGAHVRGAPQLLQHWNEPRKEVKALGNVKDEETALKVAFSP